MRATWGLAEEIYSKDTKKEPQEMVGGAETQYCQDTQAGG